MSGGRASRQKGDRFEREIVELFRRYGLEAMRVPLSGATEFAKGDVVVRPTFSDRDWVGECKRRAVLPAWLLAALGDHDFAVVRADRHDAVVIIPARVFAELLQ